VGGGARTGKLTQLFVSEREYLRRSIKVTVFEFKKGDDDSECLLAASLSARRR
jgi:hypothetical protein